MIGPCRWIVLLLVCALCSCASSSGLVRLQTAQGEPIVHTPPANADVVQVGQREFLSTVSWLAYRRLLLDLAAAFVEEPTAWRLTGDSVQAQDGVRGSREGPWARVMRVGFTASPGSGSVLGSWNPRGHFTLIGAAANLSDKEREDLAMSYALDTVWDGVADAVKATLDPAALKLAISSALCTYMLLLVVPEPVSKFIAIALTAYLVAYVGCGPLWNMIEAYQRLREDARRAQSLGDLEEGGHRFGRVMGDNGGRVAILVLMAAAGGKVGMSTRGPTLPGYARAALASEVNMGLRLAAVAEGGVQSVTIRPGWLIVGAAPSAVAATAAGPGSESGSPSSSGDSGTASAHSTPKSGPGEWVLTNESMPEESRLYQEEVTGHPRGSTYRVKDSSTARGYVDFDGFDGKVLQECKGPGYNQFLDPKRPGRFKDFFEWTQEKLPGGMVNQATRQFNAARGIPVRWYVAEPGVAEAIRNLLNDNNLRQVEVVYRPMQR